MTKIFRPGFGVIKKLLHFYYNGFVPGIFHIFDKKLTFIWKWNLMR